MRVHPLSGDSPEEVALMAEIEREWQNSIRLKAELEAACAAEGLIRAKLRKLQEGLVEGEELILKVSERRGLLESSAAAPYLWLRLLDKTGLPSKRRVGLNENDAVMRPDGSMPTRLHPGKSW